MSQSENCSAEVSVIKQESKVNGKIDTIEGQLRWFNVEFPIFESFDY